MIPALIMGVLTNVYIISILVFVEANEALFSPTLGGTIFLICFILLKIDRINAKLSFLIASFTVAVEVSIHTHFLGWNSGFFYFLFLLPTVFLLNSSWKIWMIILFNGSIALLTGILGYLYYDGDSFYTISNETESYISLFNLLGTAIIVFVVMLYFSKTINKKDEALVNAYTKLENQNTKISAQHQQQKILIKEIHHRVKNNLQVISSLMSLQARTIKNTEVIKVLNDSKRRIEAIALVHQKLYSNDNIGHVDIKSYLQELMDSQQALNTHVKCKVDSNNVVLSLDTAVPLGLIISEMISNAIKHAFNGIESPELTVTLINTKDNLELVVKDNGVGLPEDFDLNNPQSLGTEIICALTEQINGSIVCSNDMGAKFTILFQDQAINKIR